MLIATRTLKLNQAEGVVDIDIRIFLPEPLESVFGCRYEIDWPEGRQEMIVRGTDSVQALVLALRMIGADIYTSAYHKAGKLVFERPGQGYGFPVPNTLRDLLAGEDKQFF